MAKKKSSIRPDGKEEIVLQAGKQWLFTREQKKIFKKEGVAIICKWCELEPNRDSLFVFNIEFVRKLLPDVNPGETYECKKCPRCNYPEGFKF